MLAGLACVADACKWRKKERGARGRHARGKGAPYREARHENPFPPPVQLSDRKQLTLHITRQSVILYHRSKHICKDQLGYYLVIPRWSNKPT